MVYNVDNGFQDFFEDLIFDAKRVEKGFTESQIRVRMTRLYFETWENLCKEYQDGLIEDEPTEIQALEAVRLSLSLGGRL